MHVFPPASRHSATGRFGSCIVEGKTVATRSSLNSGMRNARQIPPVKPEACSVSRSKRLGSEPPEGGQRRTCVRIIRSRRRPSCPLSQEELPGSSWSRPAAETNQDAARYSPRGRLGAMHLVPLTEWRIPRISNTFLASGTPLGAATTGAPSFDSRNRQTLEGPRQSRGGSQVANNGRTVVQASLKSSTHAQGVWLVTGEDVHGLYRWIVKRRERSLRRFWRCESWPRRIWRGQVAEYWV